MSNIAKIEEWNDRWKSKAKDSTKLKFSRFKRKHIYANWKGNHNDERVDWKVDCQLVYSFQLKSGFLRQVSWNLQWNYEIGDLISSCRKARDK